MNEKMKILIAYDGSACANEAINELDRAGLPSEADVYVVSVSEEWFPSFPEEDRSEGEGQAATTPVMGRQRKRSAAVLQEAERFAEIAMHRLQKRFPGWRVKAVVNADSPAFGILRAADDIGPDLIIVGSHGRSALGRVIFGSVSQKVLSEAGCSVRIARSHPAVEGSPVRIVLGVDGTPDSEAAVAMVGSRRWPEGSTVQVIAARGPVDVEVPPLGIVTDFSFDEWRDELWTMLNETAEEAASKLRAAGLTATSTVIDGAPIPVLLDAAKEWGADEVFVGAKGHRFLDRFLLGSVSAAVAARAHCSVEVVRTPR